MDDIADKAEKELARYPDKVRRCFSLAGILTGMVLATIIFSVTGIVAYGVFGLFWIIVAVPRIADTAFLPYRLQRFGDFMMLSVVGTLGVFALADALLPYPGLAVLIAIIFDLLFSERTLAPIRRILFPVPYTEGLLRFEIQRYRDLKIRGRGQKIGEIRERIRDLIRDLRRYRGLPEPTRENREGR